MNFTNEELELISSCIACTIGEYETNSYDCAEERTLMNRIDNHLEANET